MSNHFIASRIDEDMRQRWVDSALIRNLHEWVQSNWLVLVNWKKVWLILLNPNFSPLIRYACGISEVGYGEESDSRRTPRWFHSVCEMLWHNVDKYQSFSWWKRTEIVTPTYKPEIIPSMISRIVRLDWMETGSNDNTQSRRIYIHWTRNHWRLAEWITAISWWCINLHPTDIVSLFHRLSIGMPVYISESDLLS